MNVRLAPISIIALLGLIVGQGLMSVEGQVPDLTKTIDFERSAVFHLGPTGAKGWIYAADNFMTTEARQILVTEVEPGSAAEGVLEVGDVILGIGGELFSSDARMALGRAIDEAERTRGRLGGRRKSQDARSRNQEAPQHVHVIEESCQHWLCRRVSSGSMRCGATARSS